MTRRTILTAAALAAALLVGATTAATPARADEGATKEAAVKALKDLAAALEAQDFDKALTILLGPPGVPPEKLKEGAGKLIERKEISSKGVDILADKGKWGSGEEVFGADKLKRYATALKVENSVFYGLKHDNAEALFLWEKDHFRVVDLDNIGKLE